MSLQKSSIRRLQLSNFKLNALLDVTQAINANLSTSLLLERYENIIRNELNIGKVLILAFNQRGWDSILESGVALDDSNITKIVEEKLRQYTEITNITTVHESGFPQFDIVIPVYHKDEAMAYVLIGDIEEDREGISPTIKHLRFIQTITNIIIVAIENKRLYRESLQQAAFKKEMELASKMQSMLIPSSESLPNNNHIEVAAFYNPHQEVGGDYYDFIKLSDDEYGFCIADVSGKGISAAILMSNFQATTRALFSRSEDLPALIHRLNATIVENAKGEKFITLFIARYNASKRELTYINAGHNPSVLQSSERNTIEYLEKGCIGIGMFDDIPNVQVGTVSICPGDKLICYTDGLVEAENEEQAEFGTIPIEACLSEGTHIDGVLAELIIKLRQFIGTQPLFDDVSLLGIKFL